MSPRPLLLKSWPCLVLFALTPQPCSVTYSSAYFLKSTFNSTSNAQIDYACEKIKLTSQAKIPFEACVPGPPASQPPEANDQDAHPSPASPPHPLKALLAACPGFLRAPCRVSGALSRRTRVIRTFRSNDKVLCGGCGKTLLTTSCSLRQEPDNFCPVSCFYTNTFPELTLTQF